MVRMVVVALLTPLVVCASLFAVLTFAPWWQVRVLRRGRPRRRRLRRGA